MPSGRTPRHSRHSRESEEDEEDEEAPQPYFSPPPRSSGQQSKSTESTGSLRSPFVSPSGNFVPYQMRSGGSAETPAQEQWKLHAANVGRSKPWEPQPAAIQGFAPQEKNKKKGKPKITGPAAWRTQKTKSGTYFQYTHVESRELMFANLQTGKVEGFTRRKGESKMNAKNWGVVIKGDSDDPRSNRHVGWNGGPLPPRDLGALKRRAEASQKEERAERKREEDKEMKEMKKQMKKAIQKKKKKQDSCCVIM